MDGIEAGLVTGFKNLNFLKVLIDHTLLLKSFSQSREFVIQQLMPFCVFSSNMRVFHSWFVV